MFLDCEASERIDLKAIWSADVIANASQFHPDEWVFNAKPQMEDGEKNQRQSSGYVIRFHGRL